MTSYRIKLTWATPPDPTGRWWLGLFLLSKQRQQGWRALLGEWDSKTLFISLRGLLLWSLPLAFITYFAGAFILLRWFENFPHNRIRYADIVLPHRWSQITILRAQAIIAEADADFAAGRFQAGFAKLRNGLSRDPDNSAARVKFAEWCVLFRLRPLATKTLLEGCARGYTDPDALRRAFALLHDNDHPEGLLDFAVHTRAGLLALDRPASPEVLRLLDEHQMRILLALDRTADAVALIRQHRPDDEALLKEAVLLDLLHRKDYDAAIAFAVDWARVQPHSDEVQRLVVRTHREAGRVAEMQTILAGLRARAPRNPGIAGYIVTQNLLAGDEPAAITALEDYLFRFSSVADSLKLLAFALAEHGRDDLLARIETVVRDHGFEPAPVLQARLQARIDGRRWELVRQTCVALDARRPHLSTNGIAWLETATALADACLDEGSGVQTRLIAQVSRRPASLKLYRTVIDSLVAAGRLDTARMIVGQAEGMYPDSNYIAAARADVLSRLERLDSAALAAASPDAPAAPRFQTAAECLAELDLRLRDDRADEGLRLLTQVRRDAPDWLAGHKTALAERELELCVSARDLPRLQMALREHLRTTPDGASPVLARARAWHADEKKDAALLTVREIIKFHPDDESAIATLVAWTPKPDAAPPASHP